MALQYAVEPLPGIRGITADFGAASQAWRSDCRLIRHELSRKMSMAPCAR